MVIQTEYEFTLPKGFVDDEGTLHRTGVMRLATAADEILPAQDPRAQQNPAFMTIIILSRVITKLGTVNHIDTKTVERFFAMDLAYLQDLYNKINHEDSPQYNSVCPKCGQEVVIPVNFMQTSL